MEQEELVSLPLKSIHVRVSPDTHAALRVMAEAERTEIAEMAERLIEEAVHGRFHVLKVALERYSRLGLSGRERESP